MFNDFVHADNLISTGQRCGGGKILFGCKPFTFECKRL